MAVAGVLFSLSALVIEREREIGVLRAMGASRPQVLGVFLTEAALIGFTSALSGLASGGALAMVLTWIINKAFFGWTIELHYPPGQLLTTPLWIVGGGFSCRPVPCMARGTNRPGTCRQIRIGRSAPASCGSRTQCRPKRFSKHCFDALLEKTPRSVIAEEGKK